MTTIWAEKALTPTGWQSNVTVTLGADCKIAIVKAGTKPSGTPAQTRVGCLLPAPVNVHSHAFQRSLAGLTERRGPDPRDSFWTWRKQMFQFLDHLNPEQVQAITAYVQMEMLEAGFATNVEFHYLHHQPNGSAYANPAEMSERVVAAAELSGIGLTMLPVLYQYGGCDKRPLDPGQRRFGNDLDQFAKLCDLAQASVANLPDDTAFGVAPHSLRAVDIASLGKMRDLANGGPIHMHLAEQIAEVEEIKSAYGARPVEWVLDNVDVDQKWCMIHCTQMEPHETTALAKSGTIAGLCPITESSLGDGIFDATRWLEASGRIAIGSDSNIRIALAEELRTLEYSQRLRDHSRAALAANTRSTGRRLFDEICAGGAVAAARKTGKISHGYWADMMALDLNHVDLSGRAGDIVLDAYIFAGDDRMITDVWSAGRHRVKDGRHVDRDSIVSLYRKTIGQLRDAL